MKAKAFEDIVKKAIDDLPDEFRNALNNIEIVIDDRPPDDDDFDEETDDDGVLLGLYHGIPLTEREHTMNCVLPDKISLYRKAIEKFCDSDKKLMIDEIRKTLLHEIGHYFGMDEDELDRLGYK